MIVSAPVVDLVRPKLISGLTPLGYPSIKVMEDVPDPLPTEFVRLEAGADSGIDDVVIDHWSLSVQCWCKSRDRAERLAAYVSALLRDLEGRPLGDSFVYEASATSPVHFPDADTHTPRFVFSAQLSCRALVI